MASYLSYFTSNSSAAPTQQQYNQAQPATSTWAGTFSSRIATLRKALTKDSEDDDPDNEDCSHVSNVLRAYYTQKGRSFPEWLPPDPKKPQVAAPQPQYGQYGNAYGSQQNTHTHGRADSGSGRGGLSDLWESNPPQMQAPTQSLRAPRPTPQSLRSSETSLRQGPLASSGSLHPYSSQESQGTSGARPLPSQRAGSFQNTQAAGATSKADRLRARLQGGNSGRSSPANISSSGYFGESESYNHQEGGGGGNPYASAGDPYRNASPSAGDMGAGVNSRGFGSPAYRPKPGGPR